MRARACPPGDIRLAVNRLSRKSQRLGQRDIRRLLIIGAMAVVRLGLAEGCPGGKLAAAHAGSQTEDAGSDCARQRDGPLDLGYADKGRKIFEFRRSRRSDRRSNDAALESRAVRSNER